MCTCLSTPRLLLGRPTVARGRHARQRRWRGTLKVNGGRYSCACKSLEQAVGWATDVVLDPFPGLLTGFTVNNVVFIVGNQPLRRGLTPAGILMSWLMGGTVFAAYGAPGYALVCLYFIVGSAATKFKLAEKEKLGIAEQRAGQRGPGSVVGSSSAGMLCACLTLLLGQQQPLQVGFVSSFASKLSDTVSSEVGKGFGKTTYLITSLERVPPGTEGAVSVEGTVAGILAAVAFSAIALGLGQVDGAGAAVCTVSATVANILESYVGATSQGKVAWLTNDVVNVIQISTAGLLAVGLQTVLMGGV